MSGVRLLGLLVLALAALGVSALSAHRLLATLDAPAAPPPTAKAAGPPDPRRDRPRAIDRRRGRATARSAARRPAALATPDAPPARDNGDRPGPLGTGLGPLLLAEALLGALALASLAGALTVRRVRARGRRVYARYDLHLSAHDEAKPQDLEDLMEAIANTVRALPHERARDGQPFVALELHHEPGPSGAMELALAVRCQPRSALTLDAAFSATYPDVRLGRRHGEPPAPRAEIARLPAYVLCLRKRRSFVYPLLAAGDELASPPLEAIAHAQAASADWSVVRFQLTPAPASFEELARAVYRRHENRLARQERWGLPEGGPRSTLNQAELTDAQRTQNRSLFWLETTIAADDPATAQRLAAAVAARRGENRLRRRLILARRDLYRRRFATATPPLLAGPRALVSAAEIAQLLALPSARMKGVPVRRLALPRIPMPPEIQRADPDAPVPAPPAALPAA